MYMARGHNGILSILRWEFIKENKKVRKEKERKHALDKESDQENVQEKKRKFLD